MLNRIVRLALEFRGIVIALAALLIVYGCYVAARVKLDVFPEFVQPQVVVQAEAPGLAPEQVEMLVTRPIESAINGTGDLESIRSESIQGLSVITAVFKQGTDIYKARIALGERLAETAGQLGQHDGVSVRLRDVAVVADSAEPKFGDALIMGEPGVLLTAASQFGANTMEATEAVERALGELGPVFESEGITLFPRLHRPATFIEHALHNVEHSLVLGAIFVGIVLFLFLLDLRTAFISFVSIPLSLLAAMLVLDAFGVSINTMTLGGFAVAIGVVVDDAIIDVANILRRLRENLHFAAPRPLSRVVLDASLEVRSAVVYATFVVAVVFLPVLMMSGLQGRFFAPLAEAFILAIMASLVVALTVTPALCLVFFNRVKPHAEPRYLVAAKALHLRVLRAVSGHTALAAVAALVLFAGAAAVVPFLGGELLPDFREGHFVLQVSSMPGTSLAEMMRLGRRISEELLQNPHVATAEQQIGRAEQGEDTWGTHRSEFHVELKRLPADEEEQVQGEIRKTLASFPGTQSEVLTFLGDRIGETISGETAPVVVNVFGDDLDVLDAKAREVAAALKAVRGAADVQVKSPPGGACPTCLR